MARKARQLARPAARPWLAVLLALPLSGCLSFHTGPLPGEPDTSTFLTLFVVPIFYTYLDDLRAALSRLAGQSLRGVRGRGPALGEAAADD